MLGVLFHWFWKLLNSCSSLFFNLLFLVLVLLIATFFLQPPVEVPDGAALVIDPAGDVVEQATVIDPFSRFINGFAGIPIPEETLLQDILDTINAAAGDDRIQVIVLSLARMGYSGLDQLQDIGHSLEQYKTTGKKVIAIDDDYNQGQYYLASFADEILLNPMGAIHLRGFGVFRLYMKEFLDRLAINFHVFKVGSFKSAIEPFTRNDMSAEAREANQLWLANLWNVFCEDIARNRGFEPEFINSFINSMPVLLRRAGGSNGSMALDAGLVDNLMTRPQIRDYLVSLVGESEDQETFNQINFLDYLETITPSFTVAENDDHIGLIVAQGNIVYGEDIPGQISSDSLGQLIRQARDDDTVKAVVLRIDSGGGSAFASEQIRQELLLLQQTGKPLVISMGATAASGAYWIAAGAEKIYASPFTLTGSIGIFGLFPTFEESIAKIGISSDGTGTTRLAGAENPTMPLSPELQEIIQLNVEEGYSRFVSIVAEGRQMPLEEVIQLAEGRVWDGAKAMELGLVDGLGGLDDAIGEAATLAGLTEYSTIYIQEPGSRGRFFLQELGRWTIALLDRFQMSQPGTGSWLAKMRNQLDFLIFGRDPGSIFAHSLLPRAAVAF